MEPSKDEINTAIEILKNGGVILYPTDTVWGIGCDATNATAVSKIYKLKNREETKAMICLVSDIKMLEKHIDTVPEAAYDIIEYADKPTTIIYDNPAGVAENLIGIDNTLGIRIVSKGFSHQLVKYFRRPIVSTSANKSGEITPRNFKEISADILASVDYVVNLPNEKSQAKPSSIIQIKKDGQVHVIRI
ncbi:MAG: threonylcarbamoyl-AMP synthase [Bacteroidetes bacterium HGW-Bacteroidetes-2]|jgi:L-threonylcarbamoyladenylate synthase|nr:MAG: threonylcarbamoyl-AMP synthase [Bacteroidetes bacterium HGW-Bacteroidetes-2]